MIVSPARVVPAVILAAAVAAPAGALAADLASTPAPAIKAGDTWVFERSVERGTTGFANRRLDFQIEHVGTDTMVVGIKQDGAPGAFQDRVVGADWSQRHLVDGNQITTVRPFAFPLTVGKTWTSEWTDPNHYGLQTSAEHHASYKVAGWENVTTPAGTFHAIRVESDDKVKAQFQGGSSAVGGGVATADGSTVVAHSQNVGPHVGYGEIYTSIFYVPEVKYWVKTVEDDYNSDNVRILRRTDVLVSFKPAP